MSRLSFEGVKLHHEGAYSAGMDSFLKFFILFF